MKKKLVSLILALALVVSAVFVLVSCNTTLPSVSDEVIAAAEKMDMNALLAEAKKETGDFIAYGNTSRITTAMTNFVASEYGKALGLTNTNAVAVKKSDSEIYELLRNESQAKSASGNASMVLIQDSASLDLERGAKDPLIKNYVSAQFKDKVDEKNRLPLAHQFINKLFMYNVSDKTNTAKFDNVWELTKSEYKGQIFFKSPKDEQVNMNFLIMLTSDEWSGKLEKAYKALNNNAAATDVGEGKTYKNYGYKWIAEFLANCNFSISSDTTIASTLSKAENKGKMGLFVLSKLRDASVYGDNLQVSAWDLKDESGEKVPANFQKIDPFAGFMYSIYAQLAAKGPRPYTAMLFINYLMTAEGFTPWESLGGYSANKDVPVYEGSLTKPVETSDTRSKDGLVWLDNNKKEMILTASEKKTIDGKEVTIKTYTYLEGGATVTDKDPTTGKATQIKVDGKDKDISIKNKTEKLTMVKDQPLSFWADNLVIENGAYVLSVKADVQDWINTQLSKNTTVK